MDVFDQTIISARSWIKFNILKPAGLWHPVGPAFDIEEDDVLLISFPRSGNTWMRFLLASLRHGKELRFNNIDSFVPDIYKCSQREIERAYKPRLIKSHEAFNPDYPRAICIFRDPRDVAISLYHQQRRNKRQEGKLEDFLKEGFPFESWANDVGSWLDACDRDPTRYLSVRYEDLKANTLSSFECVTQFLDWNADKEELERAIDACSADRMRRSEIRFFASIAPSLTNTNNCSRDSFVRKAASGQWRDVFDASLIGLYEEHLGDLMSRLGYPKGLS